MASLEIFLEISEFFCDKILIENMRFKKKFEDEFFQISNRFNSEGPVLPSANHKLFENE